MTIEEAAEIVKVNVEWGLKWNLTINLGVSLLIEKNRNCVPGIFVKVQSNIQHSKSTISARCIWLRKGSLVRGEVKYRTVHTSRLWYERAKYVC